MQSSLTGVRILNLAPWLPGLYCTMLLADLGADVILVEHPSGKERSERPPGYLSIVNRNKRSLTLDLKLTRGKEIFLKLIGKSDVFVEGLRPGSVDQLGIGYEDVRKINARLIYCSITGYGQDSPCRSWPAHNNTYMGIAGMVQATAGDPIVYNPRIPVADLAAAMFATISVLAALQIRDREGNGQYIEVPIVDCAVSWMSPDLGTFFNTGHVRAEMPATGFYKTIDGEYLSLSVGPSDRLWGNLAKAVGLNNWSEMPRMERLRKFEELEASLREIISRRTRDEWLKLFVETEVPCGPVHTLGELTTDPHIRHRNLITEFEDNKCKKAKQVAYPVRFSEAPVTIRKLAPALGEDTDDILQGLGYTDSEIKTLRKEGAV